MQSVLVSCDGKIEGVSICGKKAVLTVDVRWNTSSPSVDSSTSCNVFEPDDRVEVDNAPVDSPLANKIKELEINLLQGAASTKHHVDSKAVNNNLSPMSLKLKALVDDFKNNNVPHLGNKAGEDTKRRRPRSAMK